MDRSLYAECHAHILRQLRAVGCEREFLESPEFWVRIPRSLFTIDIYRAGAEWSCAWNGAFEIEFHATERSRLAPRAYRLDRGEARTLVARRPGILEVDFGGLRRFNELCRMLCLRLASSEARLPAHSLSLVLAGS